MGFWDEIKKGWEDQEAQRNQEPINRGAHLIVEAVQLADIFSPFIWFAETFAHDRTPLQTNTWTFYINNSDAIYNHGLNTNDIVGLVRAAGIEVWAVECKPFGDIAFSVSRDEAQRAEEILLSNNVPINPKFVGAPPPKGKR